VKSKFYIKQNRKKRSDDDGGGWETLISFFAPSETVS
jgi:hypothetical protein